MFMDLFSFQAALLGMDRVGARTLLANVRAEAGRIQAIEGLVVPTMESIGVEWEQGRLAQVYMGGRIREEAVDAVLLNDPTATSEGPLIGLAAFEDQHPLGKRIVASVLKSAGYRIRDYGQGIDAEELAHLALGDRVPLLMVSVLMLHSALHLKALRTALNRSPSPPILVAGGAPFRFDPSLGQEVGVDAFGTSALDALRLARHYVGEPCLI